MTTKKKEVADTGIPFRGRRQTDFLVALGVDVGNPSIYGDFIAWQDHRDNDDFDIYGERISDDER